MDFTDAMVAGVAMQGAAGLRRLSEIEDLLAEQRPQDVHVHVTVEQPQPPKPVIINTAELRHENFVDDWDSFVGQGPLKNQLRISIESALCRFAPLEHTLLASGMPGVGKTTLARLIAKEMGVGLKMLVPPFHADSLVEMAKSLQFADVLFIDEIHKLADHGPAAAENLLHLMEERRIYTDEGVIEVEPFTLIGATTDADKLPEPVVDRFVNKPYFQAYSDQDMVRITYNFSQKFGVDLRPETMVAIAKASRRTPRVSRELVLGARDLTLWLERPPHPHELLEFKEMTPDGMTRQHRAYLSAMYRFFGRTTKDGTVLYVAGESSLRSILRETKQGVARLERFLIEQGLLDRSPQGRRLTPRGIEVARQLEGA